MSDRPDRFGQIRTDSDRRIVGRELGENWERVGRELVENWERVGMK